MPDRACLTGIPFVLRSGIPGKMLPRELECGSGVTCWCRLRDWQTGGVWDRIHRALLDRLGEADMIDWSRAALDAASDPAKGGRGGRTEPDRSRKRRHQAPPRHRSAGIPLEVRLTVANRHESTVFKELLDAIPPIMRRSGQQRRRPDMLHVDKAYGVPRCRRALSRRRINVRIARKGIEPKEPLGCHREVIQRTLTGLNRYRRLTICHERNDQIHQAFPTLGCALICFNHLPRADGV